MILLDSLSSQHLIVPRLKEEYQMLSLVTAFLSYNQNPPHFQEIQNYGTGFQLHLS